MFYIDWEILMLDQNFWHIQIFHIHSAIQQKKPFKTIRKNYHHLPSHTHTQTQTSYPTHHKRSSKHVPSCTMTAAAASRIISLFLTMYIIPRWNASFWSLRLTATTITKWIRWYISEVSQYLYHIWFIWAWNMYRLRLYLQLTISKPKHDTLNMIPDHNDKWQLNT